MLILQQNCRCIFYVSETDNEFWNDLEKWGFSSLSDCILTTPGHRPSVISDGAHQHTRKLSITKIFFYYAVLHRLGLAMNNNNYKKFALHI